MKRRWTLLPLVLALLLAFPRAGHSMVDTIYVDRDSSCAVDDGSEENPYCSIDEALKHAGPDIVIAVKPSSGPYRELVSIVSIDAADSGTVGHPVVLLARGTVVIDGSDTTSSWVARGNLWAAKVDFPLTTASVGNQVWMNNARYTEMDTTLEALEVGRCLYDPIADSIYVNFGRELQRSAGLHQCSHAPPHPGFECNNQWLYHLPLGHRRHCYQWHHK